MGSLVPGWETKPEPDFRERGKVHGEDVPEWLQRVRSIDSDRDVQLHHAMEHARAGFNNLQRNSFASSQGGSPTPPSLHSADGARRVSSQLKHASVSEQGVPEGAGPSAEQHIDWWRRLESSHSNCKPDAERPESYRHGNYVPQHDVAKQHTRG